jgi:transcriptional antiterminator RfaH
VKPSWYAIHCDARRAVQTERLIAREDIETFNPRIPRTRKRNGDKPLFPSYMFARLDLSTDVWTRIQYTPGIRSLVEIGGGPCPVDDAIVERIRRWVGSYEPVPLRLRPGDRVTVTSGALADLEGVFCEALCGAERVAILIEMMRRQIRVELGVDDIEVLAPGGVMA